jgi:AraC-like DNA-binding protein
LGEALSIPDLAGRVGLSPSRFAERFQKVMGITPRIFFEQERLGRARQMLRMTNLPVKSIAAQLGFRSELYFSSRFRALTGVPPTAYRRAEAERESPGSG